jgi:hypothetical protein
VKSRGPISSRLSIVNFMYSLFAGMQPFAGAQQYLGASKKAEPNSSAKDSE